MAEFARIAPIYDLMTGFHRRLVNDFGVIKHVINKYGMTKVLDAGCGTGVHTIILSKIGVDVVGLDASAEMLDLARSNALNEGVEPNFLKEFYESMPDDWTDKFDGLFCLANSLVGVVTMERLSLALKSFQRVVRPGGHTIIQLLNFEHFQRDDQRIIKVSNEGNFTFVRFFDFEEHQTRLNVIVIERDMGEVRHRFISEPILPLTVENMSTMARACRFSKVDFYSDLSLTTEYTIDSKNLVVDLTI